MSGDGEKKTRRKTRNKKIEKQATVRGSAGDKAGPVVGHLTWAAVQTHSVLVRGSCSVNQKTERIRRCLSVQERK